MDALKSFPEILPVSRSSKEGTGKTGKGGFPKTGNSGKNGNPIQTSFLEPVSTAPRRNARRESAALVEVLKALRAHPCVAWAERQNSGAVRIGRRFVRFGWTGCADVLGQLRDGRLLAVEVKAAGGRLRPEQTAFLVRVNQSGGVAFVARSLVDVNAELSKVMR